MSDERERKHQSDAQEVTEILDAVSKKIPELINGLKNTLFSAEAGRDLGKAVGSFYKELVENGIDPDTALSMTKDYLGTLHGALKGINFNNPRKEG